MRHIRYHRYYKQSGRTLAAGEPVHVVNFSGPTFARNSPQSWPLNSGRKGAATEHVQESLLLWLSLLSRAAPEIMSKINCHWFYLELRIAAFGEWAYGQMSVWVEVEHWLYKPLFGLVYICGMQMSGMVIEEDWVHGNSNVGSNVYCRRRRRGRGPQRMKELRRIVWPAEIVVKRQRRWDILRMMAELAYGKRLFN